VTPPVGSLVDQLRDLKLPDAPSRGGPYVGVVHTDLTRQILASGDDAVPLLLDRLPDAGYDEATYIVFLLRELDAKDAVPAVTRLQSELEERSRGRDLTLTMQVRRFMEEVAPA
jgi:hypothetical protein